MRLANLFSLATLPGALLLPGVRGACAAEPVADGLEFFEKKIRPVLVEHCYECHSAESKKLKAGFRLDTREALLKGGESGPALVPGKPDESLVIRAVRYADKEFQMPPKTKLRPEQIADLEAWVKMGAPDPRSGSAPAANDVKPRPIDLIEGRKFWAFQPVGTPGVPKVQSSKFKVQNPVDAFILSKLEEKKLKPAPVVDKRSLIRRATFDLIGLPPTPAEVEAFLADTSPEAFAKVVDRLLASPHYGERWGRHWLDVARYSDSNGLDENLAYANAFRYRDYVIRAFNEDKPYDRFVHEQLAGDLLPARDGETEAQLHDRLTATAFLSLGPKMLAEDDPMKMEMDIVDEQVDTTCRALLGLTMGCARCHDHKFDPLPTGDYYSLAGIFKSTRTMENFKVVAVWHEHTVATPPDVARSEAHEKRIKEKEAELKSRTATAQKEFLDAERAKAGKYFAASTELLSYAGNETKPARDLGELKPAVVVTRKKRLAENAIIIEAENFTRGTFLKRGAIIQNAGDANFFNEAEWDVEIPADGNYQLDLLYTSAGGRHVRLFVNGQFVKAEAANQATGGFQDDQVQWFAEGIFNLKKGRTTFRAEQTGPTPHLDKLALTPTTDAPTFVLCDLKPGEKTLAQLAREQGLNEDLLQRWVAWLRTAKDRTVEAALADAKGPFQLPPKPERFYSEKDRTQIAKLDAEQKDLEKARPLLPKSLGVREGSVMNLKVHLRGNYLTQGAEMPRRFPQVLASAAQSIESARSGRLEFAQWLTSAEHPLTSRVMVNRIWQWHFGAGLVRSPDNFGRLGERPTHPELLDWLAREFMSRGWSVKAMHRVMMLSTTYQMSGARDSRAELLDPENKLLSHFSRRRLEAEEVRDAVLVMGGKLNLDFGGQLMTYKNREYVTGVAGVGARTANYDVPRRSVYLPILRSAVFDVLQAFDFGDPSVINGERGSTVVAPQALFMMNGDIVARNAGWMADDLLSRSELGDDERIRLAYERAFARPPTGGETKRLLAFVEATEKGLPSDKSKPEELRRQAWRSLCRVLIASNEFIFVE